jgi:hypothetical protein
MKLLKKSQPAEAPAPSLAERISQIRAEAAAVVEAEVARLKATPDACSLPIDWLRADLRARTGSCSCACALALLEPKNG